MGVLKFEKIYNHHKIYILLKDVDIKKVLGTTKVSFDEKNYKYFIGYLYNDHTVKPLHMMLPKVSGHIKGMIDKLNGCIFLLKMMTY